jgi:hypothetical protein
MGELFYRSAISGNNNENFSKKKKKKKIRTSGREKKFWLMNQKAINNPRPKRV